MFNPNIQIAAVVGQRNPFQIPAYVPLIHHGTAGIYLVKPAGILDNKNRASFLVPNRPAGVGKSPDDRPRAPRPSINRPAKTGEHC